MSSEDASAEKFDWRYWLKSEIISVARLGFSSQIMLMEASVLKMKWGRIWLKVAETNQRAVKCYLGCGFREEGRLRQALFLEGRYVDALIMGAVREDWTQPVP